MNTFPRPMLFATSLALLAGCASDALTVQGTAAVTLRTAGGDPTEMRFDFSARPTTLEAGADFTGRCARVGDRWEVQVARENPGAMEFKSFTLSIPVATGPAREATTASFVVGASTFTGSTTCADTTTTTSDGLHVVTRCTSMRAPGDSRVVDASVNLAFNHCSLN